eukprot:TRINITY_DN55458_c0_g1_i1.p1 TRINITY_DN55458_c0_g1~~TRINITY_DN55458_c0_g1_i1.p1  ORF type:complete len:451 (+),score=69.65 TRINITY_DN55458_c0_g1_i1:81-1433(+)
MTTRNMQVVVPPGAEAGHIIQVISPEGVTVQATIPLGVPPGNSFIVQYPIPEENVSCCEQLRRHKGELICAAAIIFTAMLVSGRDPMRETTAFLNLMLNYSAFFVISLIAVVYDWNTLGPTVAIKYSAIATAVAWVVIVPCGFLSEAILGFAIVSFGLLISVVCCVNQLWPCGVILALVTILLGGMASKFLDGIIGQTLIFVAVFFIVRQSMGQREVMSLHSWPNLSEVHRSSHEFQTQCDCFMASCLPWADKYDFELSVKSLFRVTRPGDPTLEGAEGVRSLFHGTQWESAKGIVCDGFRLPDKPGMFGKGIYYADCPLKSWRYCFPTKLMSEVMPRLTGHGGLIFMCSVSLGKVREEKAAAPHLVGYRKTLLAWFRGNRDAYDSVVGLTEESGGALRVPEYVIFKTNQVQLAYLFEVEHVKKSVPRPSVNPAQNQGGQSAGNSAVSSA